ncbi:MAG: hypothetical protein LBD58_09360 [Treponema sp.]|jgi:hypothetical protein|nr:hypothetical protein [Treponema sp.]
MDSGTIISIMSLGLCALFFIYCNAYIRRRTGQERILAEFKEEVSKLIAEIDVATDRDATLIEDRIKTIKALLDDVDKRILLYDQELAKRRANEDAYAELGRKRLVEARVNAHTLDSAVQNGGGAAPVREMSVQPVLKKEQHAGGGALNGAEKDSDDKEWRKEREEPPAIHSAATEQKPVLEQIAELSRAGFSPNLIATRLGMSISEIELAIAIAEQRS